MKFYKRTSVLEKNLKVSLNEGTKRPRQYNKNKRVRILMHQCGRENQAPNLDGNELEIERQRGREKGVQ